MKRIIFFIVSLLTIITGFSQVTPNYPQKPATPTAFRHLMVDSVIWLPYGTAAVLREPAATTRPGALFVVINTTDTLLKLWTGERWIDIAGSQQQNFLPNELIFGGSVTPLGGYDFHVQEATFRIDNIVYQSDAQDVTITASDGSLSRIDRIFLMANTSPPPSGIADVLEGELAVNPLEPQIDGDQIGLAFISIPAGASAPTLVSTFVYNENTGESTVTNTGTTTDPANTTNVNTTYGGTKSLNVTNINDPSGTIGDIIFLTKPSGVWSVLGFDGLSFFLKLKAVMPGSGNLRVQLIANGLAVSTEALIPVNKSNITTYQPITIPAGSFGNITNTSITAVRIRYTRPGNTANYTGFYLDDMFFIDGISQPSTPVTITQIPPVGFQVSPQQTISGSGTWTWSQVGGSAGQYYSISGWTAFPVFVQSLGALDGRTRAAEGATIDGDELFLQTVNDEEAGLATPDMFERWNVNYYIQNAGDGDTLAFPINDTVTGIKSIKVTGGLTISTTDTTLIIDGSGVGGSGGRFGVSGEDDTQAEASRSFDVGVNNFNIDATDPGTISFSKDDGVGDWSMQILFDSQNLQLNTTSLLGDANIILGNALVYFNSAVGTYEFENLADDGTATKVVVYNTTSDQIGTVDLAGLGGGSGATTALDNLAAVAINTSLISDANNTDDLGSASNSWKDIYARRLLLDGATSGTPVIESEALGNVINGTVLSGTGTIPVEYDIYVRADETLVNTTSDQPLFTNAAHDVITILANTTYDFEAYFDLTHSAVSHDLQFGMIPTTATITNIAYYSILNSVAVGTPNTSQYSTSVKVTNTNPINLAAANAVESVIIRGWFTVGATGGTIQPTIQFSADPTGTILLKAGARFKVIPRGNDTFTEKGPIN